MEEISRNFIHVIIEEDIAEADAAGQTVHTRFRPSPTVTFISAIAGPVHRFRHG